MLTTEPLTIGEHSTSRAGVCEDDVVFILGTGTIGTIIAQACKLKGAKTVICCDILSEGALKAELIDAQVEQLMNLAEKFEVEYDGWGTYFEDPNGEDGEEGDDEDFIDEDDDGVRH